MVLGKGREREGQELLVEEVRVIDELCPVARGLVEMGDTNWTME